jgi:serine/threonine protein kinase
MKPQHSVDLHGLNPRDLLLRGMAQNGGSTDWIPPSIVELAPLFSGYEIKALLGRGGMGAVYQAWQPSLGRLVAIKLLPLEVSSDQENAARFEREARALARLQHPNIITVHDFGTTSEGHLFFVMEYVDGTDLAQLLRGGRLNVDQVLDVIRQVCDALRFAHAAGIVHRDIKPANILVDRTGRVKVGDFGLAKLTRVDAPSDQTSTRVTLGTPAYIAPEQWRGRADHRADIYSLGVMFYEMLTGEVPRGAFDPPSKKADVDARLDPVVLRAMQQEPDRRYQQVAELRSDVDRVGTRTADENAIRHWRIVIGTIVGAVSLAAFAAFLVAKERKPSIAPSRSASPAALAPRTWTNSLGMKFVPLGADGAQICIWETRVRDFKEFASKSKFEVPRGLYTLEGSEWKMTERTWSDPGFEQTLDHPACGVSWNMAQSFCHWLTERERGTGKLPGPEAHYRLPTDFEWSQSIQAEVADRPAPMGNDFVWGRGFPAHANSGNFAGEEVLTGAWPSMFPTMRGYSDDFRATAPVGSFPANSRGIFDLAGNVWEWCEDGPATEPDFRWLRGGGWVDGGRDSLRIDSRGRFPRQTRVAAFGFRVVLAPR